MLTVTELTEQAYAGIAKSLKERKPFAAVGPAGTGKTETIKDFAMKLGRKAVTINCNVLSSEPAKVLLDFADKSDCWLILDEYNLMPSAVLTEA
jgi:dynein heavy chain